MEVPALAALAAAVPLVALGGAVLTARVSLAVAAWGIAFAAVALALTMFDMTAVGVVLGVAKGLWTGIWILALVIPALLLFGVVEASGALDRLTDALHPMAPTPGRRLLLLACVLPTFLQGAAGFGLPVVVAAPMLVRAGMSAVAAVAAVQIGYHWSVTFGSMGSSFFVAAGTTQLDAAATSAFAVKAAILLSINAVAAVLLVLRRHAVATADTVCRAVVIVAVMSGALLLTVVVQPALGSTVAGLAGLLAAAALLPARGARPPWRPIVRAAAPYLVLAALVVTAFGVPFVRDLADRIPAMAPSFPDTTAAYGHVNPPITAHQPLRPLLHPGPYLLVAAAVGALLYRRFGWHGLGRRYLVRSWAKRSWTTASSLLGLTVLAGVMVDAGMVAALAQALTGVLGRAYAVAVPVLGAVGTILTGSTTASNALLAPLQADAAARLGAAASTYLAGQTAGGNVGNAMAPITILVAAVAAGAAGQEGAILRRTARDAVPLVVLLMLTVLALELVA